MIKVWHYGTYDDKPYVNIDDIVKYKKLYRWKDGAAQKKTLIYNLLDDTPI